MSAAAKRFKNMEQKTTPAKNYKNFDSQIEAITFIESLNQTSIIIYDYENCKSELTKTNSNLKLKIEDVFVNEKNSNEIPVIIDKKNYILKSSDFCSNAVNADIFSGVYCEQTFDVYAIRTLAFNENGSGTFQCIFPCDISKLSTYRFIFETMIYEDDKTRYGFDCIRITLENKIYDVIQLQREGKGYIVIENLDNEKYKIFRKICFAIQQAMGFLTGYMPGGEEYIFCDDGFKYSSYVRPALKSIYHPVNTNPYSKLHDKPDIAGEYYGKLTKISSAIISNLVDQIHRNQELSSSIILLMEAASVKSLLMIPSVSAIIIESLSKLITFQEQGKLLPIKDVILKDKIINKLNVVIDSYKTDLGEDSTLKLKRRVNEINRPVIKEKLTNNEKLTIPFEQLGIKITIEDIQAIEHRNDLLHGNILLLNGERLNDNEINSYMLYVADRLFTLISKLILKYAGYNGYVINYSKFSEKAVGIETNEGYFVEI